MAVIGIDLGTTNSLACVYRSGRAELIPNALGNVLTPSVVSLGQNGEICVGAVAKERLISHPAMTAASFKRFMGTNKKFSLGGQTFTPQELSAFVLRQLREDAVRYLGEEVTEAVISVPAYFNDNQRYATREAGQLAGLKVERLINEPSAAALASSRISGQEEQSYLVFDFGGGTLDVSVVDYFDNVIEIVAVSGDNHLGGIDFDLAIAEYFCRKHGLSYHSLSEEKQAVLLRLSEKCKRELTEQNVSMLRFRAEDEELGLFLNNEELIESCAGIFDRIIPVISRALKDSDRGIEEIDEIVLVGGSAKMPAVACCLESLLRKKPAVIGSPDQVVAMGAGYYAGIKERNQEIKDLVLTDICPFTLGTNVENPGDSSRPVMSPIIERNSVLPTSKKGYYVNAHDYQKKLLIGVYQGEAYYCADNLKLGQVELDILPVPKGKYCVEVCFTYDINGLLEVEVNDLIKSEKTRQVMASQGVKLSPEQLSQRLNEMNAYSMQPPGGARTRLTLARGERLFKELTGAKREAVAVEMRRLQEAIATQNDQQIRSVRVEVTEAFDRLEEL